MLWGVWVLGVWAWYVCAGVVGVLLLADIACCVFSAQCGLDFRG